MLARLVEQGLLLTDPPSEVGHQMRDEALRRSQWWPLAALAHRHARWQAVDSVEDMRRQGLDTAAGLRQRLGPPPPVVQPMQGDYQPLPRSEEAAFDALLARRTTCRNFDPQRALPLPLLAQVLQRTLMAHAVQKVERDTEFLKKNVPSGGGLHPTEGFLLVQNVEGLAPGLYHYHPVQHAVLPLPRHRRRRCLRWRGGCCPGRSGSPMRRRCWCWRRAMTAASGSTATMPRRTVR
jgi:putative peptide maturation dehydrogenase